MKKGILSFTVVLAFAIVNVLGCFSASAVEGASIVARKIYVDDDFNDREEGGYIKASGAKSISHETDKGYQVVKEADGNKCIKNNSAWKIVNIWGESIDSDKIGLSFKYKIPKGLGNALFQLRFGDKPVLIFQNSKGTDNNDSIKFVSEKGEKWLHNTGLDGSVWTRVDVVFEKRDGGRMYMEKLYINGVSVNLKATLDKADPYVPYNVAVDSAAPKWWESGFSIKLRQALVAGFSFDDIMLYEPTAETGFESVDFVNGTITIRNANADALNLADSRLIVAAYDKGDNLLGTAVKEIDANLNLASGESTSVSFAGVTAPTGTAYYKFFAWNNLNDMVPLFTQAEVTAK